MIGRFKDGSRAAATSKMELFVIIVNGWCQPPGHRARVERTKNIQNFFWKSSERLMSVQFMYCVLGIPEHVFTSKELKPYDNHLTVRK